MMYYLRASSLTSYSDCPRRTASIIFKKLLNDAGYNFHNSRQGVGSAIGTSVHKSVSELLTEKQKTGLSLPNDVIIDIGITEFRNVIKDGCDFDATTESPNTGEKQVSRMSLKYAIDIAPSIEPESIEQRLEAKIPFTVNNIALTGQSDLVAKDNNFIFDLKTGVRSSIHNAQLGAYSLLSKTHNFDVKGLVVHFVKRVKVNVPQPEIEIIHQNLETCEKSAINIIRHIDQDLSVFLHGDYQRGIPSGEPWAFIANPKSNLCSEKFCPAYKTKWCKEWQ